MSRIPILNNENVAPEILKLWEKSPVVFNVNRVAAHAETTYRKFFGVGASLLGKAKLPDKLREFVILRVAHRCKANYEWLQHVKIAAGVGCTSEQIEAVKDWEEADCFDDLERAVLRFTDEVLTNVKASDETYSAVASLLDHRQMVELILAIGFWGTIAVLLVNVEVDLDDNL